MTLSTRVVAAVLSVATLVTAAFLPIASSDPALAGGGPELPMANAKWDYQIGKAYKPRNGVTVVSRDREAKPFGAGYTMCYVNAYQTQPGEVRWWKNNHPRLLLKKGGKYVVDGFWGEILLDVGTADKRKKLAKIVGEWIETCADDGFDAIEPDNLDSWTRSRGELSRDDNFAFANLLIKSAHNSNVAIGQKNAAGSTKRGARIGFDFAVAEECGRWRECQAYTRAYSNEVFVIEYRRKDFKYSCNRWGDELSIILRNLNVTGPGSKNYVYRAC